MVAINDRSYNRSWPPTIDRMINRVGRRMGSDMNPRNISTFYSVSEQPIGGTTGRKVARPVARLIVRPLTIWNSRFQVLNMTIDLVATDLPIAITHDLCHQSYDLCHQSYVVLRLAHHSNIFRSQVGRNLIVSRCDRVLNMTTTLLRLMCPLRSPTTSAISHTFFLRLAHFSVARRS